MFCVYLLLLPLGDVALRWANTAAGGNPINRDRAIFSVVNAITLTGFQSIIGIGTYPPAAQFVILVLTFIGILFSLIVGGLAVVRVLGLPYDDHDVFRFALGATGLFVAIGCIPPIDRERV